MASIGLTIPAIAVASIWLEGALPLTVIVSMLTVVPGRAPRLQGAVHLVPLAAFLFLVGQPAP